MTTLSQLIERSRAYDADKRDYDVRIRDTQFVVETLRDTYGREHEHVRVGVPTDTGVMPMAASDHGWSQLLSKLETVHYRGAKGRKPAFGDFLAAFPAPDQADILGKITRRANGNEWKIRAHHDSVRAVVDRNYPVLWNTQLLEKLVETFRSPQFAGLYDDPDQAQLVSSSVGPDSMNVRVIFHKVNPTAQPDRDGGHHIERGPATADDDRTYGLGVSIRHDETGAGGLYVNPFIYRLACANGLIATRSAMDKNGDLVAALNISHHRAYSPYTMLGQYVDTIGRAFQLSGQILDDLLRAEQDALPSINAIIQAMTKQHGWSDDVALTVARGTEGQATRAGLVNGLTWAAHAAYGEDDPRRVALEILGGEALYTPAAGFEKLIQDAAKSKREVRVEVSVLAR